MFGPVVSAPAAHADGGSAAARSARVRDAIGRLRRFVFGPSCRHVSLHFALPWLKHRPRGFNFTPWGTPSGSQKMFEQLHILDFPVVNSRY